MKNISIFFVTLFMMNNFLFAGDEEKISKSQQNQGIQRCGTVSRSKNYEYKYNIKQFQATPNYTYNELLTEVKKLRAGK